MIKSKIILILALLIVIFFLTGCTFFDYFKPKSKENNIDVDESKDNLAILLKKDSTYDNITLIELLNELLDSIQMDLGINNIGVLPVNFNSLDELDEFIEDLYYDEDVGYAIMIGRNLAWGKEGWEDIKSDIQAAFWHINDELCFLESNEFDNQGLPAGCSGVKDIAISWIVAPDFCNYDKTSEEIDEMKREIVNTIISNYIKYHNNPSEILGQYRQSCLYVYKQDSLNTFYERDFNNGYQFEWTLVLNTQYDKVWEEFGNKHLILYYAVHGTRTKLMINKSASDVFITVDDYAEFIEKNSLPSLFVDYGACESTVFQYDCNNVQSGIYYCWPQLQLYHGAWAFYGSLPLDARAELSTTSTFIGHVLRHYQTSTIVFGDIAAHMM